MIRLFNRNETNFNHNETVLKDVISCKVIEESNSLYECELEYPKNEFSKQLTEGKILKIPTSKGEQLFRIYKPNANLKTKKIYAKHIFYDMAKNFIEDTRPTNTTGSGAITSILNGLQFEQGFTGTSDITTVNTAYYVRMNPIAALIGTDENSFLNRWGGELNRDNFIFSINQNGGMNRGYEIRFGKNLTGIDVTIDTSEVVTRYMPTVVIENNVVTTLPEKYIDSPLIDNYEYPYISEVRISLTEDQKALDIEEIYTYMREYCSALYESGYDKPTVNYKVNFVELSKTEQYKDLGILEQLNLYDTVTIKIADLDIDVQAKVIKTTYDCLKERFESLELGSFKTSLASQAVQSSQTTYKINQEIESTKNAYQTAIEEASQMITGNLGGYVLTRVNAEGKPYEILVMDTEDINTAVNVIRLNKNGMGFSTNGYNGDFNSVITIDGLIAAERLIGETVEGLNIIGANIYGGNLLISNDTNKIAIDPNGGLFSISKLLPDDTEIQQLYINQDGNVQLGSDVVISWSPSITDIEGLDDALTNNLNDAKDYTDTNVNTVQSSVNALKTNIGYTQIGSNYVISPKIVGGTYDNSNGTFTVDENGNCVANSFSSTNAHITGGSINIQGSTGSDILLRNGTATTFLGAGVIGVSTGDNTGVELYDDSDSYFRSGLVCYGRLVVNGGNLQCFSGFEIYHNTPFIDFHFGNTASDYSSRIIENSWGALTCQATWTANSDERLKNTIEDINDKYLQLFDLLKVKTYFYNSSRTDKRRIGFKAQDIEKALKDLNINENDFGALVRAEDENGYLSLAYDDITALNTAKIKQVENRFKSSEENLKAEIESLKSQLADVQATILNLQSQINGTS